jgi:WD40 repeat protein
VGIQVQDLRASPFYITALEVSQHGGVVEGELVGISAARVTAEPRLLELSNLQYLALLDPAQVLVGQDPEAQVVVLVDALDEVRYGLSGENVLSWLAACPELPTNVRFVLTSRPDPDLLDSFRRAKAAELVELPIDPEGEEDRDRIREDLHRFLDRVAAEPAVARALRAHEVEPASFVEDAADKAGGNFQYAAALARGIDQALATKPPADDLPALLRLEGIPSGTTELYRFFLRKIKRNADRAPVKVSMGPLDEPEDRPAWDALYHPVLSVLAVAYQPLSPEQLQAYAAVPPGGMPRVLEDLAQFLDSHPEGRYRLYHATFPEFLTGDATATPGDPFHVDPGTSHGLLVGRLLRANPDWSACQDHYALSYAPAHLLEAASDLPDPGGREEVVRSLSGLLTDFGFLEQKTALLDLNAVLTDFRAAEQVIPRGEDAVVALRHVMEREAHNLHGWDRGSLPAFFAQQIHNRAVIEGLAFPREVATRRLRSLGKPHLILQWQMGQVGQSPARTLLAPGGIRAMAMTPDGLRAVSGSRNGFVTMWDLESGNATTLGNHRMKVRAVAITADGRRALSGSEDQSFKVWDLENRQLTRAVSRGEQVFSIAITPDGRQAICGLNPDLEVWDLESGQLLKTLTGHRGVVSAVAVTADGRRAVSAAHDNTIKVWNLENWQLVRTLSGHGGTSYSVAVTADARLAVSGSSDLTVKVWSLENWQLVRTLTGHKRGSELYAGVNSVAVTADGRRVVSGADDCTVKVWDLSDGESRTITRHEGAVHAIAVTADGRLAASGSDDGVLKLSNLDSKEKPDSQTDQVSAVAVTPDGRHAVIGSPDGVLKLLDVEAGTEVRTLEGCDPTAWAITPDGWRAVSGSIDGTVKLWDLRAGAEMKTFAAHKLAVSAVAVTADGRRAISGSSDGTLNIWDLDSGKTRALTNPEDWPATHRPQFGNQPRTASPGGVTQATMSTPPLQDITAVAVTADGRRAISGGSDGTLSIWDLDSGDLRSLPGHDSILAVAMTPDGDWAVSASLHKTLKVWDLKSSKEVATLTSNDMIMAVAITPDGRWAITGGILGTVEVWDLKGRKEICTLTGHKNMTWAVAITPDGRRAITGAVDGALKIWDLKGHKEICTLTGHKGVVRTVLITPDGERAVSAALDGTLKAWDLRSKQETQTLIRASPRPDPLAKGMSAVAITPDGHWAVSGREDGTLKAWDLQIGQELRAVPECVPGVSTAAITPDGRRAIFAMHYEKLNMWDLKSGKVEPLLGVDGGWDWAVTSDFRWALSCSFLSDGPVKLWDLEREKARTIGHHDLAFAVAVTPDGHTAISGSVDLKMWDLMGRKEEVVISTGHKDLIFKLAIADDGSRAVSGATDRTIRVWDLKRGEALGVAALDGVITALAASADATIVLAVDGLNILSCLRLQ